MSDPISAYSDNVNTILFARGDKDKFDKFGVDKNGNHVVPPGMPFYDTKEKVLYVGGIDPNTGLPTNKWEQVSPADSFNFKGSFYVDSNSIYIDTILEGFDYEAIGKKSPFELLGWTHDTSHDPLQELHIGDAYMLTNPSSPMRFDKPANNQNYGIFECAVLAIYIGYKLNSDGQYDPVVDWCRPYITRRFPIYGGWLLIRLDGASARYEIVTDMTGGLAKATVVGDSSVYIEPYSDNTKPIVLSLPEGKRGKIGNTSSQIQAFSYLTAILDTDQPDYFYRIGLSKKRTADSGTLLTIDGEQLVNCGKWT